MSLAWSRSGTLTIMAKPQATLVPNDQLWFHHPDMQARVVKAERDFAEGRSTQTRTPEEAQALLDSLKQRSNP